MSNQLLAVLVDIDGTLLDSNDAHTRAWQHALRRQGHDTPHEAVRPLIGKGGDKVLADLFGARADEIDREALDKDREDWLFSRELHNLRPTRGARDLMEKLHAASMRIVVATSAQAAETAALLKQAGIDDLIHRAADSSDASQSKPDPDIVQSALGKAGVRPSQAVMLGDTPYDIEAARKAGVPVVVLRCGGWWNDDAFAGAVSIFDDPASLLKDFDKSPLNRAAGLGQ